MKLFKNIKFVKILKHTSVFALCFSIISLIMSIFVFAKVKGDSMANTLHEGQIVVVNKLVEPKRFDIVVMNEVDRNGESKFVIKRVIGMPEDEVEYSFGKLTVNGQSYDESYVSDWNSYQSRQVSYKTKVPTNSYFLLGDNRDYSKDSRVVGFFKKQGLIGTVIWK